MAQSPEYPDLPFIAPRSWRNANRPSVQLIVMHTTEGAAHSQAAADGAAYDARRTDGTSAHFYHDSDNTVQCVHTEDVAHTARTQGNLRGIHHELCGRAGWTAGTWSGEYAGAMLQRAARQCARDAKKWGIPARRLTVLQVASGAKGFCGHNDITRAFPQDGGDHTDPGPNFPWTAFLAMVRAELEDDVPFQDEKIKLTKTAAAELVTGKKEGDPYSAATILQLAAIHPRRADLKLAAVVAELAAAKLRDQAILAAVQGVNEEAILARIDELAAAESARDADLRALVEQHTSGQLDAEEVVQALAARLAT